jgi:DNA-directed RNA polymerase beta subunit
VVENGRVRYDFPVKYLTADEEDDLRVAPEDVATDENGYILGETIPVRYRQEFSTTSPEQVDYVCVSPVQIVSVATSLIPFLEHDDANRALMGSNMQRQAVPLLRPERPLVGTGLEAQAARRLWYGHRFPYQWGRFLTSMLTGFASKWRMKTKRFLARARSSTKFRNINALTKIPA